MKIRIDYDRCAGHARCEAVAPDIFATDEVEGKVVLRLERVSGALEQTALRGAKSCPERAIIVMGGEDESTRLWPPEKHAATP
jgi:ferredoxin